LTTCAKPRDDDDGDDGLPDAARDVNSRAAREAAAETLRDRAARDIIDDAIVVVDANDPNVAANDATDDDTDDDDDDDANA
jgi:hypothetical protein